MPNKNLGTSSSGYLNPDGRAWETVVFQAGKPVLDKELVLSSDLDTGAAQDVLKRLMPSGWLSDDFLSTSSATSAIFNSLPTTVNTIEIPKLVAHVNGWIVKVEYTNSSTSANRLDLGAGPTSGLRTDLVILEVWRRLISATPDTNGKSQTSRIWLNGNVKITSALDPTINLADDLKDANVASETTKRVQIQYRLRVIKGVDVATFPQGMGDLLAVAQTVPANALAASVDGTAYSGANPRYANQSSNGDAGLWRAGDGTPTNGLGTVDGYMYALPLLAVFRRNTAAFNRITNQNGAGAYGGTSGRPDDLYHDIITSVDVVDLRCGVSPKGWSPDEVLSKNLNLLLDNGLRQEVTFAGQEATPIGRGTTVLRANEINGSDGGLGIGPFMGYFDTVRRRFSDRSILETAVIMSPPNSGSWTTTAGKTNTISLTTTFAPFPYSNMDWSTPSGTGAMVVDILEMHWAQPGVAAKHYFDAMPYVVSVTGLATREKSNLVITFSNNISALNLTTESLYITVLVAYPRDKGLTYTPSSTFTNSVELLTNGYPAAAAYNTHSARVIDPTHREVQIEYLTQSTSYSFGVGNGASMTYRLPDRVSSLTSVTTTPAQASLPTIDSTGRLMTLTTYPNTNSLITVQYVAVRPVPLSATTKYVIWYRSAAPAAVSRTIVGTTLSAIPLSVLEKLLTITCGTGSQGESYPFPLAHLQTGGVYPGTAGEYNGEVSMNSSSGISVADFSADTGMLTLPTFVPMAASPEGFTFSRSTDNVDQENRTFFPTVSAGYIPNAYAQDLSLATRHKNVLPILAELSQDSTFGVKGQLVLILLVRYAALDAVNGVFFKPADPSTSSTVASVVRVKGLLLNKRVS